MPFDTAVTALATTDYDPSLLERQAYRLEATDENDCGQWVDWAGEIALYPGEASWLRRPESKNILIGIAIGLGCPLMDAITLPLELHQVNRPQPVPVAADDIPF